MQYISGWKIGVVGIAVLAVHTAVAAAEEAVATTSLNVRTGPGITYEIVDTLSPGEVVDLTECQTNGWCYISDDDRTGWVSSRFLTAPPSAGVPGTGCRFELEFGRDGPSFRIVCGDGGDGGDGGDDAEDDETNPVEPDEAAGIDPFPVGTQACFYDAPNFGGAAFCRGPVVLNSLPGAANDAITSVMVGENVQVRLCQDVNMGGFCRTVTASEGQLGGLLDNAVSSLQVFDGPPPPLPRANTACFYDLPNFSGASFCRGVTFLGQLPAEADNRISSIRIAGDVHVELCQDRDLGGFCREVTGDEAALGGLLNNQVTSLRVFRP
ncbi:SH3 domain-containing protein [Roseivivax sp. CAU 1753]